MIEQPANSLAYSDFLSGRFFGSVPCGWAMPSESARSMSVTSRFFAARAGSALLGAGFFLGALPVAWSTIERPI